MRRMKPCDVIDGLRHDWMLNVTKSNIPMEIAYERVLFNLNIKKNQQGSFAIMSKLNNFIKNS